MINYEIKSQLAKLLATEDLVVENRDVETAQFDVERRVLTLPLWKLASEKVYNMLVGHEVGHALFTPNDWSWEDRIPKQFVNVTEDARIEKLMKRRYPGLAKDFYKGYEELSQKDFFGLEEVDIDEMNLADRANLYFKIGRFVDIPIKNEREREIISMMEEGETFGDSVMIAEILYAYCQAPLESVPEKGNDEVPSEGEKQPVDSKEEPNSDTEDSSEEDNTTSEETSELENSTESKPIEVQTDEAFTNGTQDLIGDVSRNAIRSIDYVEIPKVNLSTIIISNDHIHQELNNSWNEQLNPEPYYCPYNEEYRTKQPKDFTVVDTEYSKFKNNSSKEVNYLVKEFESKKSADAYSRAFTSKTGTLDCTKLHTYQYNEDLFKKVNVIPDGKNHGLIFILDWSGSMNECLLDTIQQLFNLIWFCKKVNIPFDVYAFTNSYLKHTYHENLIQKMEETKVQEVIEYNLCISPDLSLMHFFTSDVSKKVLDMQMKNIFRVAYCHTKWCTYDTPAHFTLSGTPLNEAIVCLHELIPEFKKKNNVQKINTIILTDGEANVPSYFKKNSYYDDNRMGFGRLYAGDFVRNRKTGFTYKVDEEYWKFTDILLRNLKQTFPDINTIGIRLACNSDFKGFVRRYSGYLADDVYKKIRKEKFVALKSTGYTSYFGMLTSGLSNETEFDVEEGASKAEIKSAFAKNLHSKALNRKVLSQFVDIIS